ncbi:MAG: sugar transferase [Acidimicrobiia bacterium]|nr:sugar transferase [Acidimicrobiia bacterium]
MSGSSTRQHAEVRFEIDLRDSSVGANNVVVIPGLAGGRLGRATRLQKATKRGIDIMGAITALTLATPLLTLTAILIKLTSPGPVLYRQIRIGQNGIPFTFLKFRSMYTDADTRRADLEAHNEAEGPIFKIKQDPRITPIGRIIRKFSIDEAPQLLHVLTGKLSLVGPRPHLPEEVNAYDGIAHRRLAVKPGITGIWQVSGRSDLDFDTWIDLDIQYLDTWSVGLDLKLLAKTITAVTTARGAY